MPGQPKSGGSRTGNFLKRAAIGLIAGFLIGQVVAFLGGATNMQKEFATGLAFWVWVLVFIYALFKPSLLQHRWLPWQNGGSKNGAA